jgi:hypothetical protein
MPIKRLTLKKILSFNESTVELGRPTVLIGPNAVGESNPIEAISLLQAAPIGIEGQILRGGGVRRLRSSANLHYRGGRSWALYLIAWISGEGRRDSCTNVSWAWLYRLKSPCSRDSRARKAAPNCERLFKAVLDRLA